MQDEEKYKKKEERMWKGVEREREGREGKKVGEPEGGRKIKK